MMAEGPTVFLGAFRCSLCGGPSPFPTRCAICSAFVKHIAPTVVWLHEHAGEDGHAMAAAEESAWFGDPNIPHEPGAKATGHGWRPVCSCGFRAPLTHATEGRAMRAAQNHAAVSSPRPQGRYSAVLDGDTVHIRCATHPEESLASFAAREYASGLDGHGDELRQALREHDQRCHEEGDDD